jgi:hypothetical protein
LASSRALPVPIVDGKAFPIQIRKLWQRLKFRNAKARYRPRAS